MSPNLDFKRNTAIDLDLGWINHLKVNRNAADRRAASLANRRTVKKEYQAAWLIRAIECIDLTWNWQALYDEMVAYRKACGDAHVKAILATGELVTLDNVAKASWVCMMAGADFIKTSTGKEGVNATIPVSLTMVRAIREYY